jgi:hypothetical protein
MILFVENRNASQISRAGLGPARQRNDTHIVPFDEYGFILFVGATLAVARR